MGTFQLMFRLATAVALLGRHGSDRTLHRMREASFRREGSSYTYGVVDGGGDAVVLCHGWGLAHGSYRKAAEALGAGGFRVVVPDLPGFGGSDHLPLPGLTMRRYGTWLAAFLEHCEDVPDTPVHLVGHSFGGAVAAELASERPDLVASVTLVSSVSSTTWRNGSGAVRLFADRPVWDWGVHLVHEFPLGRFPVAALDVLSDLSHNLLWHLPTMGAVADMIRRSDMSELQVLGGGSVPVAVVRANGDQVVTEACFRDQCRRLGVEGTVVDGNHGWPISRPVSFAATIGDIIRSMAKKAPEPH